MDEDRKVASVDGDDPGSPGTPVSIRARRPADVARLELLGLAFDAIAEAAYLIDEDGRFADVNAEACRTLGYSRDELLTLGVADVDPNFPPGTWPAHWAALRSAGSLRLQTTQLARDGRVLHVEVAASYLEHRGRGYNLALVRDVAERIETLHFFESLDRVNRVMQTETDLDAMLSRVLDEALDIFDCDRAFLLYPCDPEAATWTVPIERTRPEHPGVHELGLEMPMDEYVAQTLRTLLASEAPVAFGPDAEQPLPVTAAEQFGFQSILATALRPRIDAPWQFGLHQCDRPRVWTPAERRLLAAIGGRLADGLTAFLSRAHERALEGQLRQANKMEAIGQLAGGVAHDFNNLITVIRGYGELMRDALPADAVVRADLEEVIRAADRAADVTRQLLAFSRRLPMQPQVLAPARVVRDLAPMLQRLLGEHIDLVTNLQGDARVFVDRTRLEQVIINLALNARDAMPDGGRLEIRVESAAPARDGLGTDRQVLIKVLDTGSGMSPATRQHVFEPFFTTKAVGKGTGLGLATVFGIVVASGGMIDLESEEGIGTTFRIYLPEADRAEDPTPLLVAPPLPSGHETILLVEDDEAVRSFARRSLIGLGYRVLEARNGAEALAIAGEATVPIHLLLTDVVMPGVRGTALADEVRVRWPATRVLLVSGYTDEHPEQALGTGRSFLAKPYSGEALARRVRQALDGAR